MREVSSLHTSPIVSVVMPTYNSEKHIEEAIKSVQRQTLKSWELIIVDDCSSDTTAKIVEEFVNSDSRIKIISHQSNQGVAHARNTGYTHCCGKYIALLDSDDVWKAQKLEKQVEIAERSHADVVYCSYSLMSEDGSIIYNDYIVPVSTSYQETLVKSVISCSTALLKKELTRRYFFTDQFYHEDFVYWLQILRDGNKAVGTNEVLASYRLAADSRASNKFNSALKRWKVYREYCGFSVIKSLYLTAVYAVLGLKKYRKSVI